MAITKIESLSDAVSVINDNLDYFTDTEKAYNLYNALNYLVINRPASSNINGISMSYSELMTLRKDVLNFINKQNKSFFLGSTISQ